MVASGVRVVADGKVGYIHETKRARKLSNGTIEYESGGRWVECGPLLRQTWREETRGGSEPSEP